MLPLVATELSRPRDAAWGALTLFLGVVLLTNSDRLRGELMLVVLLGGLLIFRLGFEVSQGRWQQLSDEEKVKFRSFQKWSLAFDQLTSAMLKLASIPGETLKVLAFKPEKSIPRKKWVRPEQVVSESEGAALSSSDEALKPSADGSGELSKKSLEEESRS